MRQRGTGSTGRVCSGAQERARFSSVAPSYVIRTVVTPAAERQARDPDCDVALPPDRDAERCRDLANGRSAASKQRIGFGRVLPSHANHTRSSQPITAAAHKLARIIYHILKTREPYDESVFAEAEIKHRQLRENRIRAMARALGYTLAPLQAL